MSDKPDVLIVDDDAGMRRTLELLLKRKGFRPAVAGTGKAALALARERFFNVALVDVRLPDMEGIAVLARLKELHPNVEVLLMTGYASLESAIEAVTERAYHYLTKPLNLDEVVVTIRDALKKQHLVIENERLYQATQRELAERVRAEEALRRSLAETACSNRRLLALSQAGQAVQRARTPEDVYRIIGEQVAGLGFETTVFTLTDDRAHLVVSHLALQSDLVRAAEKLTGLSAEGYRFPMAPGGFFQRIVQEGKTAFSQLDVAPFAEALPRPVRPLAGQLADLLGWEQSISAPLSVGGKVEGLLSVTGVDLTEADVPAITVLGNQASAALENVWLLQAEHEQRELAEMLRAASHAMGASLDLVEVLHLLLDQLRRVLVYDSASVLILREGDAPPLVVGRGYAGEGQAIRESGQLLQDSPILRRMARDLQSVVSADVGHLEDWTCVPGAEHVRSWLGIPLIAQGRMVGALMVDHTQPGVFGETELQIAQALAHHASQAVENARLYAQGLRRNRDLALLNRVIAASAASKDVESILETVCRELALAFDVPQSAAALFNEGKTEGVVVAEYLAEGRPSSLGDTIPVVGNPASQFLLTHKVPLAIEDTQTDPRLASMRDLMRRRGTVSLLLLPLIVDGEVIGSLGLDAIEPRRFSDEEQELVQRVAEQVSGALARARLEETQQRLSTAVEQAAESVIITDAEGTILYVNPAFEQITGYAKEKALGQNPRFLKSGEQDAAFYRDLWATISAGRVWHGQFVNRRQDGTLYTEEATISPVRDERGALTHYVAVQRDVTEELRLETQLRQAQKMEVVGRLAGGVAHDFNNVLTAVQGYTEIVLDGLVSDDPQDWPSGREVRADLGEVVKAAERAAGLTRQLLAFSRKQVLQPRVLDLNAVIAGFERMLRRLIGEDVDLVTFLAPELGRVTADPGQIEQVIMNLAVNARDAMPRGGKLTLDTANVVLDDAYAKDHLDVAPGAYVVLALTDTGVGMTEEVREHLFEPFFTTKEEGKGTGLGLATVYGIVKQSGGHVNVYSEPGVGTTFKVYLPREGGEAEVAERARASIVPLGGTETILVAEDQEAVRALACRVLREHGYTVLESGHPEDALRLASEHGGRIHLLLTDVVMPGMSGRELAERLSPSHPGAAVLYISGYTDNAIVHHGVLDAGTPFLQKPFTPATLARKVREVLDGAKAAVSGKE